MSRKVEENIRTIYQFSKEPKFADQLLLAIKGSGISVVFVAIRVYIYIYVFNRVFLFRIGYRWITRLLALACYALFLMPGFLQGTCITLFCFVLVLVLILDVKRAVLIQATCRNGKNAYNFLSIDCTVAYCYYFSENIRRSIVYGDQPRNRWALFTNYAQKNIDFSFVLLLLF